MPSTPQNRLAPLTCHLRDGGTWSPRSLETLQIADDRLRAVLEGRAYLLFDGGMGTMLQTAGMPAGAQPELLNLSDPATILHIQRAYVAAGAEVITTNTFGANSLKLGQQASVNDIYNNAVALARAAGARYVAGDIGPLGTLLRPLGTLSFDEAYVRFAECARAAKTAGADLIVIETMTDLTEMRAAVLAAKEQTNLPIFATMTFESDGRTFLGTTPEVAAATLDALGADVVGINCSLGPAEIRPLVKRMRRVTTKPLMVQANAGLPHVEDGKTLYDIEPETYAQAVQAMVEDGVTVIGGCCGTTPAYIRLLADIIRDRTPRWQLSFETQPATFSCTSAQTMVELPAHEHRVMVIGERINPTGKKRLQEALRSGNLDYVIAQGISQQEQGAQVLDVNVGMPDIDEPAIMHDVSERLQASVIVPLQFDSSNPLALEAALRRYPGKAIINSVNGSAESLEAVLPLAAHYGANIVGLTLDEDGIPATAAKRLRIARSIVDAAARYGIGPERILIDCLVMTASTNQEQISEIIRAVQLVREQLHVHAALGVSNVSFGLPARELINATFLAAALGAGLDAPIMNPGSARYMDVIRAYRVLNAEDQGSAAFIEHYAAAASEIATTNSSVPSNSAAASASATAPTDPASMLHHAILTGRKTDAAEACQELLTAAKALDVIDQHLIPALNEVGDLFDNGTLFLPQLMASAEAARAGFDVIRATMPEAASTSKGAVVLATVKGDIHDIGKNIVKMLLENYGFTVYDLGRDVDPADVLGAVELRGAGLVGLSALMTTTVPAMQETIELVHNACPGVPVMVGGAVLTPAYAKQIGADYYAKDAAAAARIAEEVLN